MVIHSLYGDLPEDVVVVCEEEVLTRQDAVQECDLNNIMRQYARTGLVPAGLPVARYGDFTLVEDFQEAQAILARAQEQFQALPAKVRDRFANSPAAFLSFVSDRGNLEEARSLGLLREESSPVPPAGTPKE